MDRKEQESKKQKSGGWFSGWFGGSSQTKEEETLTAAAIGQLFHSMLLKIFLYIYIPYLLEYPIHHSLKIRPPKIGLRGLFVFKHW
jgi:hypothetical protein